MYSPGTSGAPVSVSGSKYTARGALLSERAIVDMPMGSIVDFQATVKGKQRKVGAGGSSIRSFGTFERRPTSKDMYTSRAPSFQASSKALPGTTATNGSRDVFGEFLNSRARRMQVRRSFSRLSKAPQQRFPEMPPGEDLRCHICSMK